MKCRCTTECKLELETGMPVVDVMFHDTGRVPVRVALQHIANTCVVASTSVFDHVRRLDEHVTNLEVQVDIVDKQQKALMNALGGAV